MGILRSDRVSGLGGANAINGSVFFGNGNMGTAYDSLKTEPSSDFIMGTGDFTLEGWFYIGNTTQNWQALIGDTLYGDTGGWTFYVAAATLYFYKGGASVVNGGTVTANTWHHLAFSRASGSNRLFIDGAVAATASDSTNYTHNQLSVGANNVDVGGAFGANGFDGYASNVRVTKGTALYTAAFTPPITRLEKRSDTVLLCCQSPGNAEQEATGKIIKARGKATASHFVPDVGEDHGTTFADNTKFDTLSYMVPPAGTTAESNRGRAIFMGGYLNPSLRSEIYYVQMQSEGNAVLFGDLSGDNGGEGSSCASSTRALQGGGSLINTINYITIATTSNSTDFGDITVARRSLTALSSNTRGIWAGGTTNPAMSDVIDYATIATTGNATDFGNLTEGRRNPAVGSITSTTRGVFAGGNPGSSPLYTNVIDYITIASTGNATDFGDQVLAMREQGGASSSIRGLIAGGHTSPANLNRIEYITIASTGNAADFGDLNITPGAAAGTSNKTRALFAGGSSPYNNSMEYVTIATTGNAKDFGDLPVNRMFYGGTSDSHGGIS